MDQQPWMLANSVCADRGKAVATEAHLRRRTVCYRGLMPVLLVVADVSDQFRRSDVGLVTTVCGRK